MRLAPLREPRRRIPVSCGAVFLLGISLAGGFSFAATGDATQNPVYLPAIRTFADQVLRHGRDTYGSQHTPLFVDGINVDTHEPARWKLPADFAKAWNMPKTWIMGNLASDQTFFRVLDGLTRITGKTKYRQAAIDATRYAFEHLQYRDGLLFWGGHCMWDLETDQPVGESHKDWTCNVPVPAYWDVGTVHELKHHYPYYQLMWQTNPATTQHFIEAFWAAHIDRWDVLDMTRHGLYGNDKGSPWDHPYSGGPVPFKSHGLPLFDAGSDLMYAACSLYELTGDDRPLTWAKRLAKRYADICHPKTGLGPDVYSHYRNERYLTQFSPEFDQRFTETNLTSIYGIRYTWAAVCQLKLAERLGSAGTEFLDYAHADLTALARYAYDSTDNRYWVTLTDGTRLSPSDVKREGTVSPSTLQKRRLGPIHFWAYALAYKMTNDPLMLDMARKISGPLWPSNNQTASPSGLSANAFIIFGLLELYEATEDRAFLTRATEIGDQLLVAHFHNGFFVPSKNHLFCRIDTSLPYALLHLEVALRDLPVDLPMYLGSSSYFHCPYMDSQRVGDGVVFSRTRAEALGHTVPSN